VTVSPHEVETPDAFGSIAHSPRRTGRGFRPRPGLSLTNAEQPPSSNLLRHKSAVWRLTPTVRAAARLDMPSARRSRIRLLSTNRCGVVPARTQCSRLRRSSVASSVGLQRLGIGQVISARRAVFLSQRDAPAGQKASGWKRFICFLEFVDAIDGSSLIPSTCRHFRNLTDEQQAPKGPIESMASNGVFRWRRRRIRWVSRQA
jgi:hypothetical protein